MRMKAKTYRINFLSANRLQLNIFSYKLCVTKKTIPYVLVFIIILKSI